MSNATPTLWVYLSHTPLLWLTLTVITYQSASWLYERSRRLPIFNPVLLTIVILVTILAVTGTPYQTFFDGAQFVHFLLGPATVALAIPLFLSLSKLKQLIVPVIGAVLAGAVTSVITVAMIGQAVGLSPNTLLSLIPKSVTTPIAMGVSEKIGGTPSLTAVFVILTGILGAAFAKEVLDLAHIREHSVRGFAIGVASHGIGTARALQLHPEAGAFAGLAMGLNGIVTTVLVPILVQLLRLG